jgi:hypothetical protein
MCGQGMDEKGASGGKDDDERETITKCTCLIDCVVICFSLKRLILDLRREDCDSHRLSAITAVTAANAIVGFNRVM